jgi:hypothetical protein
MLPCQCRAKREAGKDAGSADIRHIGATEDADWRRVAAGSGTDDIA